MRGYSHTSTLKNLDQGSLHSNSMVPTVLGSVGCLFDDCQGERGDIRCDTAMGLAIVTELGYVERS